MFLITNFVYFQSNKSIICLLASCIKNGRADSKMSSSGSNERPRPSNTMIANITDAKLDSSLTYNGDSFIVMYKLYQNTGSIYTCRLKERLNKVYLY